MNALPRSLVLAIMACLCTTVIISSCATSQSQPTREKAPKKTKAAKPLRLVEFEPEADLQVLWRRQVGQGIGKKFIDLSPAAEEETIFAADAYGYVVAFSRDDPELKWRSRLGRPMSKGFFNVMDRSDPSFVTGGIGVGVDTIFLGTARGEVVALSAANGEERWRVVLTSEVLASPTASRDAVFVQTSDGNLFALAIEDGSQKWVFHSQNPLVTLRGTAAPVISSGIVYAGFGNGVLVAIDATSGELLWEQTVSLPAGTSELNRMVDVDGKPLVESALVFASAHQGTTRAMRRSDGQPIWEADVSSVRALQSGYGLVFAITDEDEIVAIEQRDGTVAWRQDGFLRRNLTDPLAYSNYIFVGDFQGFVHVIAQSDGRLVARRRVDSSAIQPTLSQVDGIVYLLTKSGKLVALELDRSA